MINVQWFIRNLILIFIEIVSMAMPLYSWVTFLEFSSEKPAIFLKKVYYD